MFRNPLVLRWVHPEKRRWYTVIATSDLFGDLVLIRSWGSLDNQRGGEMREILSSKEEIKDRLRIIAKQRRRHGYLRCSCGENGP